MLTIFEIEKAEHFMRNAEIKDAEVGYEMGHSVINQLIREEADRIRQNAPEFLVKVVDPCADDLAIYSKAELDEIARATMIADKMARALIDLRRANAVKGDAEKAAKEAGHAAASANENWRVLCGDLKHDFMPA